MHIDVGTSYSEKFLMQSNGNASVVVCFVVIMGCVCFGGSMSMTIYIYIYMRAFVWQFSIARNSHIPTTLLKISTSFFNFVLIPL